MHVLDRRGRRPAGVLVSMSLSLAVVSAALMITACSRSAHVAPTTEAPEQAVEALLGLRTEHSADASAYAEYLVDPEVAIQLATADAEMTATASPIPQWETPYVVEQTETSADVVVVWIPDDQHGEWPYASVFAMQRVGGSWKAGDAVPVLSEDELPRGIE